MAIKVSIIVPIYNVERYLRKCIDSLLVQTLKDIEIILVDDESPDACPEICDEYAEKDCRVKVVHKKNEGLGFARNTGIEHAVGEYVTFCDSDDWVEPEAYEYTYNKIKEKNLDVCWFQARRVTIDGSIKSEAKVKEEYFLDQERISWFRKEIIGENPEDDASKERGFSSCMALFKRSIYVESGVRYPSERVVASEDFVFLLYFMKHVNRVGVLPNVFYNYLINPNSISTNYSEAKHERLLNMLSVLTDFCRSSYEWNDIKNHYYSKVLQIFKVILKYTSYSKIPFLKKVRLLTEETRNPFLVPFFEDPVCNKYRISDIIYIKMMQLHSGLFFYILYKLKR